MNVSIKGIVLFVMAMTAAVMITGCPLPFDYKAPGAANSQASDPSSPSATASVVVSYSVQGGSSGTVGDGASFYSSQTTTVTLSTPTAGAVIFYTDNGTPLTLTGLSSAKKIDGSSGTMTISRTTSSQSMDIHAIAIGPNMLPSAVVHATVGVSPYPILLITRDNPSMTEDGGTAKFTITSSLAPTSPLTVHLLTGGTYVPADLASGTLPGSGTLPASGQTYDAILNQSTSTVTLPITGVHDAANVNKTVTLTIQPDPAYTVGFPSNASVVILDDNAPAYTVTYNGNGTYGGTLPIDSTVYPTGGTVTVLGPGSLSLSNNVFAGWNTAVDGSGLTYSGGNMFAIGAGNVTLYAIWLPVTGTTITSVPLSATNIVIPEGVTSFGSAFYNHPNLVSVTLPSTISTITVQAFLDCTQLTTVVSNNSRYQVVNGALVDTSGAGTLMLVPAKLSGAFTIPSVASIDPASFSRCTNLTSIMLPASLSTISGNAFTDLSSAIPVILPPTVNSIAAFAFYRSSFTSITIPSSVGSIGSNAMGACSALTDVYIQRPTPPTLGTLAFTTPFPKIHVPDSTAQGLYLADTSWNIYGAIVTP